MAIDVEIQDERGLTLARYEGPPLGHQFTKLAPPSSACFRFIVPWGDATFNQEQIKILQGELQDAAMDCPQARLAELKALSSFLEGAVGVHLLLIRVGNEGENLAVLHAANADAALEARIAGRVGFRVGGIHDVVGIDVQAARAAELTPDLEQLPVLGEHLHPAVGAIANEDASL